MMTQQRMGSLSVWAMALCCGLLSAAPASAETRPKPRPATFDAALPAATAEAATSAPVAPDAAEVSAAVTAALNSAMQGPVKPARDPNRGAVTNLPLPRFVTLKTKEGNARRGPGLTHRIDWVFTRAGMPLRITAEYENWRRIEDMDGAGGWVHYSLLSGVRSVLVTQDMAQFRAAPDEASAVVVQAERGVIARVLACSADWCRLSVEGEKGWVRKAALWGVNPGEVIE